MRNRLRRQVIAPCSREEEVVEVLEIRIEEALVEDSVLSFDLVESVIGK
jgi:hypothetical protein